MTILVTGGAGYIGSHTVIELINHGHYVVIIDNFTNSTPEVIKRLNDITGKTIPFYDGDACDLETLRNIFEKDHIDAVIHFAGLKSVRKSVENPLLYYRNNLDSTLSLLEVMDIYNVRQLIFSSSATVYGSVSVPYKEPSVTGQGITNPYG